MRPRYLGLAGYGAAFGAVMAASFLVDSESLTDVLIAIGAIGLFPGVVLVQIVEGLRAMRRGRGPLLPVAGSTGALCAGAVVASAAVLVGADVYGAVPLFGDGTDTWHWGATLAMLFAEGIGLFAAVTGAVVVVVVALAQRLQPGRMPTA